jgi:hypothetical protein
MRCIMANMTLKQTAKRPLTDEQVMGPEEDVPDDGPYEDEDEDEDEETSVGEIMAQDLRAEEFARKPIQPTPSPSLKGGENAPASAEALEQAARQARKDKAEARDKRDAVHERVVQVLIKALENDRPGVFYVLSDHYPYPRKENLVLEKIYRRLADEISIRYILPQDSPSVEDLLRVEVSLWLDLEECRRSRAVGWQDEHTQ